MNPLENMHTKYVELEKVEIKRSFELDVGINGEGVVQDVIHSFPLIGE